MLAEKATFMKQQAYADGLESADSKTRTATIDGNEACADVAFEGVPLAPDGRWAHNFV